MSEPECHYECQSCGYKWSGYCIMPCEGGYRSSPSPGMSVCPECTSCYPINWVNYTEYSQWYYVNVGDGGCGGEVWNSEENDE